MTNANNYGKKILDALLFTAQGRTNSPTNTIAFPSTPYLALYTKMPEIRTGGEDGDETTGTYKYVAGTEVQASTEASKKTYTRVPLYENGVSQKRIMGNAAIVGDSALSQDDKAKDAAAKFPVGAARVANQDLIFFPEAEKEAYGEIVGFGVYEAKNGGDPYFWGELSKDSGTNGVVTVGLNEIPIFRVGDFRICLV